MTTQSPYDIIIAHAHKGVHLREAVRPLTTSEEGEAWVVLAAAWLHEARGIVETYCPGDLGRLDVIDALPLPWPPLSADNPFHEAYVYIGMTTSTTGDGSPGNNPANWHAGHVARLGEIASDWRVKPPKKTGPKPRDLGKQMATAKRLLSSGAATSKSAAARMAVKRHGISNCASETAAITIIRNSI